MANCILWDNDGTLVDTASLFRDANREALLTENIVMDTALFAKISQKQGKSILEYYAATNALPHKKLNSLYAIRQKKYIKMLQNGAIYNRDAFELIKQLKQKGIKNFMVTGSSKEELLLEYSSRSDLLGLFDGIVTAEDYPNPKPRPDCFLCVLNRWHLFAADCVVVDDLPRGIIAAERAGLRAIRYNPFTPKSKYRNFDRFVHSLGNFADEQKTFAE